VPGTKKINGKKLKTKRTRELKTKRGHMMPPLVHVCNGLTHPVDESMLAQDRYQDTVKT